jgi:peroxiredoxin
MPELPTGLEVGDSVSAFSLLRGHQDVVPSHDLWAVGPTLIHFWPFAYTGSRAKGIGCEAQVCGFGAAKADFDALGVQLVGVSHDSPFVLARWQHDLEQQYEFLSDWNWEAARAFAILIDEAFGCYRPLNTRAAFLVGRDGVVRHTEVTEPSVLPSVDSALTAAQRLPTLVEPTSG